MIRQAMIVSLAAKGFWILRMEFNAMVLVIAGSIGNVLGSLKMNKKLYLESITINGSAPAWIVNPRRWSLT